MRLKVIIAKIVNRIPRLSIMSTHSSQIFQAKRKARSLDPSINFLKIKKIISKSNKQKSKSLELKCQKTRQMSSHVDLPLIKYQGKSVKK